MLVSTTSLARREVLVMVAWVRKVERVVRAVR
jgi:hypothetical protein